MKYAAAIHKDADSDYGVTFPDLPGCFTAGVTFEEAAIMAAEAAQLHLEGYLEEGIKIPAATSLDAIQKRGEAGENVVWFFVEVDVSKLSGKAKRLNITIPERILSEIDDYVSATGGNRSAMLVDAAVNYMADRR